MKKILSILLVAMFAMATMSFGPPSSETQQAQFVIKNITTGASTTVYVKDFILDKCTVNLSGGVHTGDDLEITYEPLPSIYAIQVEWYSGCGTLYKNPSQTFTATMSVDAPLNSSQPFTVECRYRREELNEDTKTYTLNFPNVQRGRQITAKNVNTSEVQVTYADYEEVASAGQRASVALYDIYGNLVSTGYLDNLGMSTLSTKGKSGIYVVKVIMNNQVIFNQRIQVK